MRRPSVIIPPAMARSGWSTSAPRSSAISRKSCRVNSLSPVAMGTAEARRTSARPALSSAVTGSSSQERSQSSTIRQKALASPHPTSPASVSILTITESNEATRPKSLTSWRSYGMGT